MPRRKSTRGNNRSRNTRSNKSNNARQVNNKPVTMRMIPETWNMAQLDVNPLPTPKRTQLCTFRRTYTLATLAANTGDTLRAFNFTLGSLPNATEYTNLFDQYRILEVILSFVPYSTAAISSTVASAYPGLIATWLDYDDSNLPANIAEGQQYDSYQRNICTAPFDRVVHPRSAVASYSGSFASYDNVYGNWHDSNSPNVQHYGLKLCITGATFTSSTNIYEVEATVTLQCRSQH